MDKIIIIGMIVAWTMWGFVCLNAPGATFMRFWDVPSFLMVVIGSCAITATGYTGSDLKNLPKVLRNAFFEKAINPFDAIVSLVTFARLARREGLLVLEKKAKEISDPFLKKGVQLLVDGIDQNQLRVIMETEITQMKARHKNGESFFTNWGDFAPAIGALGTVMGLIHMLADLRDPGAMGPALAIAFLTTMYGILIANFVAFPIQNKLKTRNDMETVDKKIIMEGILAIQVGDNPKIIEGKLGSFLSPGTRTGLSKAIKAKK